MVPIPDDGTVALPLSFAAAIAGERSLSSAVAIAGERKRDGSDQKVERGCGL